MIGSSGLLITADGLVGWQDALRRGRVLSAAYIQQLFAPQDQMSLGRATYGAFLVSHRQLGSVLNVRGTEDRGDNAYLNDYRDCGFIVAIVTSRGPGTNSGRGGRPLFRDSIGDAIEQALVSRCHQ
jgi:hypothetical protein